MERKFRNENNQDQKCRECEFDAEFYCAAPDEVNKECLCTSETELTGEHKVKDPIIPVTKNNQLLPWYTCEDLSEGCAPDECPSTINDCKNTRDPNSVACVNCWKKFLRGNMK